MDAIKSRISAFYEDTMPCIEWVRKEGLLVDIDAMKSPQEIFQELLHILGE
ncbi:hypothetical protein IJM86_00235 [bacterium]|nr:hypothetical protein [bacterium]